MNIIRNIKRGITLANGSYKPKYFMSIFDPSGYLDTQKEQATKDYIMQ